MKYTCLNPIASVGLDQFTEGYEKTEKMEDADAVLVRSAAMHDLELPDGLEPLPETLELLLVGLCTQQ